MFDVRISQKSFWNLCRFVLFSQFTFDLEKKFSFYDFLTNKNEILFFFLSININDRGIKILINLIFTVQLLYETQRRHDRDKSCVSINVVISGKRERELLKRRRKVEEKLLPPMKLATSNDCHVTEVVSLFPFWMVCG